MCHYCHRCGRPYRTVLDGEEWCDNCGAYQRPAEHGWGYNKNRAEDAENAVTCAEAKEIARKRKEDVYAFLRDNPGATIEPHHVVYGIKGYDIVQSDIDRARTA